MGNDRRRSDQRHHGRAPAALAEEFAGGRRRLVGRRHDRRGEDRQRAGAGFPGLTFVVAPFTGWCGFTPARFAFINASLPCPNPQSAYPLPRRSSAAASRSPSSARS
ncbi:hypothetical protein BVI2075_50050 [Burkholderia vietnamiensis]|nr:hypothetical protein BVI1335_1140021 [Burkholderia vietnamiensis]CAG9210647.1 hypothetical protein BVI2075_50050 [Burkholderia vietnamiensis]